MDRELWTYFWSKGAKWDWTEEVLSIFRFTAVNKSSIGGSKIIKELGVVYQAYFKESASLPYLLCKFWLPLVRISVQEDPGWIKWFARLGSRGVTMILRMLYPFERVHSLQRDFYHYGVHRQEK
jgi:hypothetical protein